MSASAAVPVAAVHAAATLMMAGLIWFVQVVHYPLFAAVGESGFAAYEALHARKTTLVVGPLMLVEVATAGLLAATAPPGLVRTLALAGAGLVAAIWLSTFFVQVPCHERLANGFDEAAWRTLVATNWLRTALWTLRGGLAVVILILLVRAAPAAAAVQEAAP